MAKYDVITIGTATRDVFLISPYFKAIRDPDLKKKGFITGEAECFTLGGKIEIDNIAMATGGGATNAAVTFARQGFKTASLFKVGNDSAGQEIINELRREKVAVLNSKSARETISTAYSTILLIPSGGQTILVYRGISGDLSNKEIPFSKFVSKWAYVAPGKISFDVIKNIFNNLRRNGILIAFNPSKDYLKMGLKKIMPLFNQCQVVIMNREEAAYLTKIDYDNEKKIFQKLETAVKGIMVMTDGRNGAWVSSCHSREQCHPRPRFHEGKLQREFRALSSPRKLCHSRESGNPAFGKNIFQAKTFIERKTINHTGAGDAFGSGFVAGLMRRPGLDPGDIEYAIRLGAANATSVIENIGAKTGILTKKEFEQNKRWKKLKISRKF